MIDIRQTIAQELALPSRNINDAQNLWLEGETVPFIAHKSKLEYKLSE